MDVPDGSSRQVIVAYIQDPDHIIVQSVEQKADLDTLMDHIDAYCKQASAPTDFRGSLGEFALAKYSEDGGWYRAKLTGKWHAYHFLE